MTRFGASAPFKVLDEKFGYVADNVVKVAQAYLAEHRSMVEKLKTLA
jgi:transketolase